MQEKIIIVGDVRYSEKAQSAFIKYPKTSEDFLIQVQNLMIDFGVVKLDVTIDAFEFSTRKNL